MATRYYDVTMRNRKTQDERVVRGQGNVRNSAIRSARWKIRDDGGDPNEWIVIEVVPAKKAKA